MNHPIPNDPYYLTKSIYLRVLKALNALHVNSQSVYENLYILAKPNYN